MLRNIGRQVWAFDAEWVPDPIAGRILYNLSPDTPDVEVMRVMWEAGGATAEIPRPYLKTILCRVVSISMVIRKLAEDRTVSLKLWSLPQLSKEENDTAEASIIQRFLGGVGKHKPQLVGYNSSNADLRILLQRGIVCGIQAEDFCKRPAKPWEGPDYFAKENDIHIDLMSILSGWSKPAPSLHEAALLSGIPGKMDIDGAQVADLWLGGELERIIAYNECDALTTYLLWLRTVHFAGLFTADEYHKEELRVEDLLTSLIEEKSQLHLKQYLTLWKTLRSGRR